jgi:putative chitinase
MEVTEDILRYCYPQAEDLNIRLFVDPINQTFEEFEINSIDRAAAFLAQVGHESGQLHFVKENLNYSAQSLVRVFPKYFTPEIAQEYDRQPERIANRVYANRMGNGPELSGDGWRFRGRGLIQITGKNNYIDCGRGLNMDLSFNPKYLETAEGAARSAGWFWNSRGLNAYADQGDIKTITRKINGGYIGLEERTELYQTALSVLRG